MGFVTPDHRWWAEIKMGYRARFIERLMWRGDVCVWHFEIPHQAQG